MFIPYTGMFIDVQKVSSRSKNTITLKISQANEVERNNLVKLAIKKEVTPSIHWGVKWVKRGLIGILVLLMIVFTISTVCIERLNVQFITLSKTAASYELKNERLVTLLNTQRSLYNMGNKIQDLKYLDKPVELIYLKAAQKKTSS